MDGLINIGVVGDEVAGIGDRAVDGGGWQNGVADVAPKDDGEDRRRPGDEAGGGFRTRGAGGTRRAWPAGSARSAGATQGTWYTGYGHAGTGADDGGGAGQDVVYLKGNR